MSGLPIIWPARENVSSFLIKIWPRDEHVVHSASLRKTKFRMDWTFELRRSLRDNARKKNDIKGKRHLKSLGGLGKLDAQRKEGRKEWKRKNAHEVTSGIK